MKTVKFITTFFLFIFFSLVVEVYAQQKPLYEFSDPYVYLVLEEEKVKPGDQFTFEIVYGNQGPDPSEKVTISLNQPLDGRSPLELVESEPEPDRLISSEYGNLPQYFIEELAVDDPAEELNTIKITLKVRDSVPSQTLTPTASLQAPKRIPGKSLVVSEAVFINIEGNEKQELLLEQVKGTATESLEKVEALVNQEPDFITPLSDEASRSSSTTAKNPNFLQNTQTTITFLIFILLVILAFFAGRKTKHK